MHTSQHILTAKNSLGCCLNHYTVPPAYCHLTLLCSLWEFSLLVQRSENHVALSLDCVQDKLWEDLAVLNFLKIHSLWSSSHVNTYEHTVTVDTIHQTLNSNWTKLNVQRIQISYIPTGSWVEDNVKKMVSCWLQLMNLMHVAVWFQRHFTSS